MTLKLDFSKAPKDPEGKAHFEHWCMAEGCPCWGDFGQALDDRSRKLLAQNTVAGASSAASLPRRVYLCAAHRAQWLTELEEQKQKELAERARLAGKDEPEQGGLF